MTTHLIWSAAGSPVLDGAASGCCRTCGRCGAGVSFAEWVRDTFTDHDKLVEGEIVCHACQFCFTDRNELLTRLTAKDKPQRMRNYSHFVVGGEWTPLSKGQKPKIRELLLSDPQVAIIAESGQKHIIFRARLGWWQFEEHAVRPAPEKLMELLGAVERLYMEFSKAEIESGRYPHCRILRFGVPEWNELESRIKAARGTVCLQLALFLAQREQEEQTEGVGGALSASVAVEPTTGFLF